MEHKGEAQPLIYNIEAVRRQKRKSSMRRCCTICAPALIIIVVFLVVVIPFAHSRHRRIHGIQGSNKSSVRFQISQMSGKRNKICCPALNTCFTDDPPFSSPLWPLPECFVPTFTLWRKDMKASTTLTARNIPSEYVNTDDVIFLVHGWGPGESSGEREWITKVTRDLLKLKKTVNIIAVDWSIGAGSLYYPQAASNVRVNGAQIAHINELLKPRYSYCIGHSLGSHSCAHAGKTASQHAFDRITGLDPAGPMFDKNSCSELLSLCRLHHSDASQVDVIHTDATSAGTFDVLGHIDFYPNGGLNQPGCFNSTDESCNHNRACDYFQVSLLNDCFMPSKRCSDAKQVTDSCEHSCTAIECPRMGYHTRLTSNTGGQYYLQTKASEPYCLQRTVFV